ncbi:hypothetical protein FHP05_00790 [Cerasibacillus terrae]|uniref:DUF177 domain-containing protein n=1 Tax=Cerasibacillus terrae TaxID=2498845 RepID=A0A5C8P321_9BACI|nr:YceD family protein [Cerasibacillus terrae]TXL67586.1 hypothetical protein FHP05_00790 [Cerasibacillus terrae]
MKFTLGQIKKNTINNTSFYFKEEVDVSDLKQLNDEIRKINSVDVAGNYVMQGEEIIFTFTITGEMILPCARTLVDVKYSFEIDALEIFSISPYYGKEEEEEEIHRIDGEVLDLTPYIKENILLDMPFRVFSQDEKAQNNVPQEGRGWEVVSEENKSEREPSIDPRMKKLQSLLKDNKKEK